MSKDRLVSDNIKDSIDSNRKNPPNVNGVTYEDVIKFISSYGLTYLDELIVAVDSLKNIRDSYGKMDALVEEDSELWKTLADL